MLTEMEVNNKYIYPYENCKSIYRQDKGFIVWRLGTGENVELLHIRSFFQRRGYGRCLFYQMLQQLYTYQKPYHSVFGFTRVSNERAKEFYTAMGFKLQNVKGLYKDGQAVMFWSEFDKLVEYAKQFCTFTKVEASVNILHWQTQQHCKQRRRRSNNPKST